MRDYYFRGERKRRVKGERRRWREGEMDGWRKVVLALQIASGIKTV